MTDAQIRRRMATLRWSVPDLADVLGVGIRTVQRWRSGTVALPEDVGRWLDALAALAARPPTVPGAHQRMNPPSPQEIPPCPVFPTSSTTRP